MSKQWQIRRGTTLENDTFTGAVGEITMDTQKKQLRLHDGVTVGGKIFGDTVIDFQLPTAANNYTWYRLYASGWVEQGGWKQDDDTPASVILPIPMNNTCYNISTQMIKDSTSPESGYDVTVRVYNQTISSFDYQLVVVSGGTGQGIRNWCWEVKGMSA